VNFELTEEQRMIQKTVREFAQEVIAPGAERRDETTEFPEDIVKDLGEMGILGLPFPEEYGGVGADTVSFALAVEEIAKVDASLALTVSAHISLGCAPLYYLGSEEQKKRYLTPALQGEYLAAFGLTEPNAGSDAGGTETTAILEGDHWRLNGTKMFITNPTYAGYVVATARTAKEGISSFIVPKDTPGYSIGQKYEKLGMRSSDTRELIFSDARIPKENLLGTEGEGFKGFLKVLDGGRIGIAALSLGLAEASLEAALKYAKQRVQFGQPISKFQAIQFKLADLATQIEMARMGLYRAAWLKDNHQKYTKEAAMAKLFASELAVRAANEAIQIHGGYGYMKEYHVERFLRDAKLLEIGEGTSEVQRIVIARSIGC